VSLLVLPLLAVPLTFASPGAEAGLGALPLLTVILVLSVLPATEVAITFANVAITTALRPRVLPKLSFEAGIPPTCRTVVAVPALLSAPAAVTRLAEDLEIRFLGNQDPHISFALLADFPDAHREHLPEDAALLAQARQSIEQLNRRHASDAGARFHLLHRRRRWNERQQAWIGWERKRGKLEEFNHLLRGANETSFVHDVGDPAALRDVRYVITLDADTQLPRDTARQLVGTIEHPLNRPVFDPRRQRVVEGYSVVQPRVSATLTSAGRSFFARVFTGNTGLDPYTTAASDLYQDLFGEGSYYGKGIYDVDAFLASLTRRVPENRLLSHDLFEGLFARVALASDIELLDDYPSGYPVYAARQHRWVRGDWQLAPWLLPRVPSVNGSRPSDLPMLGRWKLLDNLRRSLLAPAV
jgi:cyclic beta-1,2-glucan synthetase